MFFGFRFFSSLERLRTHTHHRKKQHSAQSIKSIRQQQQQQKTSRWEKKGGVECYFIKERERTERKKGEREHFFLFRIFFLRLFQCIVVVNSSSSSSPQSRHDYAASHAERVHDVAMLPGEHWEKGNSIDSRRQEGSKPSFVVVNRGIFVVVVDLICRPTFPASGPFRRRPRPP